MKRQSLLLLSFCSIVVTSQATSMHTVSDPAKDEKEIRAGMDMMVKAFQDRDAAGAMGAYVKDDRLIQFDMFAPEAVNDKGYDQTAKTPAAAEKSGAPLYDVGYQAAYTKVKQQIDSTVGPLTAELSDFHVVVDHGHAYTRYILRFGGTLKNGTKFQFIGRTTDVYAKIDGKWLIVLEHNSSAPSPAAI